MKKRHCALLLGLSLSLLSSGTSVFAGEETSTESAGEFVSMTSLTQNYGFKLGTCFSLMQLMDKTYLDLVKQHFSSLTATNEMKAYSLLDERASKNAKDGMPVMNYDAADRMVGWAQENDIGIRGHVLVWDAYMCDWYFHEGYDPKKPYADKETIRERTKYYIHEVITHFEKKFPGVVYCWDVVNEAVGDNADEYVPNDPRHVRTLRSGGVNLFREYMGEDYVEYSFLCAKDTVDELGVSIDLYYNDYNAYFPDKAEAILALADSINHYAQDDNGDARKICDGIGMQGYIGGYGVQEGCLVDSHVDMIRKEILNYAAMGLEVQITEMAVRNFEKEEAGHHAEYYAKLFGVFMDLYNEEDGNPLNVVAIWGLTDYPNVPKGNYVYNLNSPYGGLVDETLNYKDAFWKVYESLGG
ncbi:MAG: endo-1,4-beta-xylanase, partial [Parasporobacterium sp.]|nr:endo-1,4-beta-xylanase [Parasporobacterium sp.]